MPSRLLLRRLIPLIAATGLLVFTAAPASAAASSTTETVHGVTESFPTVNPCTGDPGIVTVTYNGVFHTSIDATGGTHKGPRRVHPGELPRLTRAELLAVRRSAGVGGA
jgi:hypothetical protein